MRRLIIAPSVLACDFGRLIEEVKAVEQAGADWLHLDVMDGHFVPNISFGPVIVKAIRGATRLPLDVQLMIEHPERLLEAFLEAGADHVIVHVEAEGLKEPGTMRKLLRDLKARKIRAGLSVKPRTPAEALEPYLGELDQVLVMTVEPGFGGQPFMPDMVEKIRALRERFSGDIGVDGGINAKTAKLACQAGANVLVAGTSIFRHRDYRAAIRTLRAAEVGASSRA